MKTDYEFLYNLIVNNDLEDNKNKEINILTYVQKYAVIMKMNKFVDNIH